MDTRRTLSTAMLRLVIPLPVRQLLDAQAGVASRHQLLAHGLTRSVLAWKLRDEWRLVLPRVLVTHRGALTVRQRLLAAVLFAGDGAVVTSSSAAAWHGVTAAEQPGPGPVHVLVPRERGTASTGFVVVRRTGRPDPHPFCRGPLLIASRPRAVADAARDAPTSEVARVIVVEAVQRRIVRVADLRHELEAGPRRWSRSLRQAVQDAEAGAWSLPEVDLARLARRSTVLPPMWLNPALVAADGTELPTPDGWFDGAAVAVQVHSREYHDGADAWDETVMGDGVLGEYGVTVVPVTPRRLRETPDAVLRRIERVHERARQHPRPAVRALPLGHGLVS